MTDPNALLSPDPARGGLSRETEIRRDAQGRWWNGADPITHVLVTRSFDGWIERTADGRLCLKNDINWAYVAIEGPPYFVRSVVLERDSIDAVRLLLSGEREERLDPSTLVERADGALECLVRGDLSARFESHAVMQLAPLLEETDAGMAFRGDRGLVVVRRPHVA